MRGQRAGEIARGPGTSRGTLCEYPRAGFTLVELATVLVITGLLISAILVGKSMIESAQIQAQIRQIEQYDALTNMFRQKFRQIPGDCSVCPHSPWTAANNNGRLESSFNQPVPPAEVYAEAGLFFIDLYKMGISPRPQGFGGGYNYGKNRMFPASGMGKGGLIITNNNFGDFYYSFMTAPAGTAASYAALMSSGIFTPVQSMALDSKLDDGSPSAGGVVAITNMIAGPAAVIPFNPDSVNCVAGGHYNAASANLCRILIKANFK